MNNKLNDNANLAVRAGSITIKGVTEDGKRFRPSDWAERLATAVGYCGGDRRVRFHPRVRLANLDGGKCVIVDLALEAEDPQLFEFLVRFAQSNHLQTDTQERLVQEPPRQVSLG